MDINVSAAAAAIARNFDERWGAIVRAIVTHPRMSVLIAYGAGAAGGVIAALAL